MDKPFWSVDTLFYSECHENNNPKFQHNLFELINWYKYNEASGVPSLSRSTIESIRVKVPSYEEQVRIANSINLVELKIDLQNEKIKNFKLFKKGFKQKLINSYTIENSIEVKLKDILTEVSDKTISNNQHEVLSSTKNGIYKQSDYFNREIASTDNTGYKILKLGQFVMSPQNAWMGNYNINIDFEIGIVSPSYKIFNISNQISTTILSEFTDTDRFRYDIVCSSEQGASVVRRNLNMSDFLDIKIRIPADRKKLMAVENLLNKLNMKISDLEKNVRNLKQFKKGLLQQMFV